MSPTEWLARSFYGNTLLDYLVAGGIAVLTAMVAVVVRRVLIKRLSKIASRTETDWDDFVLRLVESTRLLPILVLSLALGCRWLELAARPASVLRVVVVLTLLVQSGLWASGGIEFWVDRYRRRHLDTDPVAATSVVALRFLGKLGIYSLLLLLALDNLGVDVTALVAGLGVGGIAVALAVQSILGDLFASLSIFLDKPFVIGDFVIVGDLMGTVDYIGLKTTRLRSLSGEQLVFSNSDLLSSRIRNFKRMAERRVLFGFGVLYDTPAETLEGIPATVRRLIEAEEPTRFDRCHFKAFGESAFEFETVYYVLTPEYNVYMDVQQRLNLGILRAFREQGIGFAYPTRTLHVQGEIHTADSAATAPR